jgi:hypothetical protein
MSRRRQANRAEAIVRGIGALLMLLVLWGVVSVMPQILEGKDPGQAMNIMIRTIMGFAVLLGVIVVDGLVVWTVVLKGLRKRPQHSLEPTNTATPDQAAANCEVCGEHVGTRVVDYCRRHSSEFEGRILCYRCQGVAAKL